MKTWESVEFEFYPNCVSAHTAERHPTLRHLLCGASGWDELRVPKKIFGEERPGALLRSKEKFLTAVSPAQIYLTQSDRSHHDCQ